MESKFMYSKSKTGELVVYHDPFLTRLSNSNAFIEEIF